MRLFGGIFNFDRFDRVRTSDFVSLGLLYVIESKVSYDMRGMVVKRFFVLVSSKIWYSISRTMCENKCLCHHYTAHTQGREKITKLILVLRFFVETLYVPLTLAIWTFSTFIISFRQSEQHFHQPNRSSRSERAIVSTIHTRVYYHSHRAQKMPKVVETACKNQKWIISSCGQELSV